MSARVDKEREEQPIGEGQASSIDQLPLTVVGIGASAGGLAALQSFFDALPDDTGMVYVVITHMDPERESMLPELLQSHTPMPVHQVQGLTPVEPENVYVIPPAQRILFTDTHLDLEEFEEPHGQRTPVDDFTLQPNDEVRIEIEGVGRLENRVKVVG